MTPRGQREDTANPAIEYLSNVRDMIQAALTAIDRGWAPYCPGIDLQYFLCRNGGNPLSEEKIKGVSMAFLDASDAILILPRWMTSQGCQSEYRRAVELKMPMYQGIENLPEVEQ